MYPQPIDNWWNHKKMPLWKWKWSCFVLYYYSPRYVFSQSGGFSPLVFPHILAAMVIIETGAWTKENQNNGPNSLTHTHTHVSRQYVLWINLHVQQSSICRSSSKHIKTSVTCLTSTAHTCTSMSYIQHTFKWKWNIKNSYPTNIQD